MVTYPYNIELHSCGPCIVWYRDDDNNSGNGDNAEVNYWWGATLGECEDRGKNNSPEPRSWVSLKSFQERYVDHATMTGMYDRY